MTMRENHECEYKCGQTSQTVEEEILEAIWTVREQTGKSVIADVLKKVDLANQEETLKSIEAAGLAKIENGEIAFTEKGEKRARKIIRQHRLAESLLYQVMNLDEEKYEHAACQFEHMLNPEMTESICTLLGHPRTCPHGRPIPSAKCCEKFNTEIQPIVQRLSDLAVGQKGRVNVIAPKYKSRLDRLGNFGIVPGADIVLRQKFPSFVVDIGETTIAIDREMAEEIFVRITGSEK